MLSKIGRLYSEVFLYKGSIGLAIIAGIALIVMMLINVFMVTIRKLLTAVDWTSGGGFAGGYEVTQVSMVMLTAGACAFTWYNAGHIRIGLLRDGMKERRRALLDAAIAFVGAIYIGAVAWGLFTQSGSYAAGHIVTPLTRIPLFPFAVIYGVLMVHVCLILLRSFIGLLSKAFGKKFAIERYLKNQ